MRKNTIYVTNIISINFTVTSGVFVERGCNSMETFASLFSAANFDRPNKLFSGFMSFEVLALPPELLFFLEFRSLMSLNDDFERAWMNADRKFGEKNAYSNGLRQELPYAKQRMMISKMTKLSYL